MTMKRALVVISLLFLGMAAGAQAQGDGSIEGAVTREDGSGIGGVAVRSDSDARYGRRPSASRRHPYR